MAKQVKKTEPIKEINIPWKKVGDDGILLEVPEACQSWFTERCRESGYSSYVGADCLTGFHGLEATEFALNAVAECPIRGMRVIEVCYRGYC